MNEAIREALEVLFSTCVELGDTGKLFAHCSYFPHVDQVSVYAHPVDHDYHAKPPEPPIFAADIYLSGATADNPHAQINMLIDKLNAYRAEEAA